MSKLLLAFVAVWMPVTAHAVCFNPMGCEPRTLEACLDEAAKMPTEAGVRLAMSTCRAKFASEAAEAHSKITAERREQWRLLARSVEKGDQVLKQMGRPDTTFAGSCIAPQGEFAPQGAQCMFHRWLAGGSKCPEPAPVVPGRKPSLAEALDRAPVCQEPSFQLQVINDGTDRVLGWWEDPL